MSDLLVFRTESPKENVACRQNAQICRLQKPKCLAG